jgi:hypothetical protein
VKGRKKYNQENGARWAPYLDWIQENQENLISMTSNQTLTKKPEV